MTRYELLERIGVGGMAEIFRGKALAAGGFEKPVAIKRILPHLSQDQRFVQLLIAEAKVLSQLRHRNIVQIFDVGLGDDGQYFLVMEFVDGSDLQAVLKYLGQHKRLLPLDIVLHLGAELCDALAHAHQAKAPDGTPMRLVHRDVSPSNILISRAGEVKLTDFGIAKRAEEATGHGSVRGKFAYISPEQARNQHVDGRSDVFSVGIVLWELLVGKPLFSTLADIDALRSVREGQVKSPSAANPRLAPNVDAIIMGALAKAPDERYPNAAAFAAALRSLRYELDAASSDPSDELANLVLDVRARRSATHPPRGEFEQNEATVIRIHSAQAFAGAADEKVVVQKARQVIERFEEEETRMAQLTPEQRRKLRNHQVALAPSAAAPVVDEALFDSALDGPTTLHRPSDMQNQFDGEEPTTWNGPSIERSPLEPITDRQRAISRPARPSSPTTFGSQPRQGGPTLPPPLPVKPQGTPRGAQANYARALTPSVETAPLPVVPQHPSVAPPVAKSVAAAQGRTRNLRTPAVSVDALEPFHAAPTPLPTLRAPLRQPASLAQASHEHAAAAAAPTMMARSKRPSAKPPAVDRIGTTLDRNAEDALDRLPTPELPRKRKSEVTMPLRTLILALVATLVIGAAAYALTRYWAGRSLATSNPPRQP